MRKIKFCFLVILWLLATILTTSIHKSIAADCSCSPYIDYGFGWEYVATTCPQEGDTADTERVYEMKDLKCVGDVLSNALQHTPIYAVDNGDYYFTKDEILAFANSKGTTRRFVNESGTHVIAISDYYSNVTIEGFSAVRGDTEDVVFNKYCTHDAGLLDTDQDGYPDCLDCLPNDNDNFGSCIRNESNFGPCPEPPQSGINTSL